MFKKGHKIGSMVIRSKVLSSNTKILEERLSMKCKRLLRLKCTVGTVCALLVLLSSIAGCGGQKAAPAGLLVIAVPSLGEENWLTPLRTVSVSYITMTIYDSLLIRDNNSGEIVAGQGCVAKRFEMSEDARTLSFDLVKGIPFHEDWGELTAADVKFSLELAMDKESVNPVSGSLRNIWGSIETPNPYKVILHLNKPGWELVDWLTDAYQYLPIVSKKYVESVGREKAALHPIGSGPYRFLEHVPGVQITVEAVEKHWYQTAKINTITWKKIPEAATRLAMLRTGEADLTQINYDQIAEVQRVGLQLKFLKDINQLYLHFLGQYLEPKYPAENTPPWAKGDYWEIDSPAYKIRRALSLAIDRQSIVDNILYGYGEVKGAFVPTFWPKSPGYDPTSSVDPYDPERALQLIREAGYAEPKDLVVTVDLTPHTARPYNKLVGEAVAMMWQKLGITVKTQMATDFSTLQGQIGGRLATSAWVYGSPIVTRAYAHLSLIGHSRVRTSLIGESLELDRLCDEASLAVTSTEIAKADAALYDYLYEHIPSLSICFAGNLYAMNPKLVWPNKPGLAGVLIHNFQYMYYEK